MSSAIGASSAAALGEEVAVDDMIGSKGNPADYKANPTDDGTWLRRFARRRRNSDMIRSIFAEVGGRIACRAARAGDVTTL
jgi:hypothetical protein